MSAPTRPSHRRMNNEGRLPLLALVGTVSIAASVAAILLLVPIVPHRTSGEVQTVGTPCTFCAAVHDMSYESFPPGVSVHVTWSEIHSSPATFGVIPPGARGTGCLATATGGTCSFTSYGGNYTFEVSAPVPAEIPVYAVDYDATYYTPAL